MSDESWRPRLAAGLKLQVIEGEAIVLDRENERVHQLNGVGTFILQRCDGSRTPAEVAAEVVERYEVSDARAREDVSELLGRMRTLAIVD